MRRRRSSCASGSNRTWKTRKRSSGSRWWWRSSASPRGRRISAWGPEMGILTEFITTFISVPRVGGRVAVRCFGKWWLLAWKVGAMVMKWYWKIVHPRLMLFLSSLVESRPLMGSLGETNRNYTIKTHNSILMESQNRWFKTPKVFLGRYIIIENYFS